MAERPLELLKGIKVLSFTQFLFGPAGVQYLADMGADVIKIEPPGNGAWERTWAGADAFLNGVSVFYLLAHRNTRSLTLNLKKPDAQDVARRLISEADVMVENFRPGVMERFGLAYEQVRRVNPRVIYVAASGYGEDGPYRDLPGQDLLVQALAGLAAATGREGDVPMPAGAAIVDQHGAALLAMGVLGALLHRERTGEGQRIEVTLMQAALDLQMEPITYYLNGGLVRRPREPLGSAFHAAPYGVYETGDGYIALSLSPIRDVGAALGNPPELAPYEDPRLALVKKDEIYRALAPLLRNRTTGELVELFRAHGVWVAPVNGYDEVFQDPGVRHLDPLMEVNHRRAGKVRMLKHPVRYSSGEPRVRRVPPEVGEHTEEILAELGYSRQEMDRLRQSGAIQARQDERTA